MAKTLQATSFYFVSLLAAMIIFLFDQLGFLQWYKDIYSFVTYPVISVSQAASTSISNGVFSLVYSTSLKQQNSDLQAKVLQLETQLKQQQDVLDSTKVVAETNKILGQLPYKKTLNAIIIDTAIGNLSGMVQLNKGTNNGVKKGMPVVYQGNYLCFIDTVTSYTSTCKTLDIPGQSLLGYVLSRKLTGTIQTTIGQVALHDLLATEVLQINDQVMTRMPDYPYYFPVGTISLAPGNTGSAERIGIIKTHVTLNDISLVTIILE